ncbi:DUF4136 domain-containing protein [Candidatus Nitrospira nitrificans]|uniref:DUF4136 domain-containing protein n=1 Tax=Candidatus Nitrospira nitrificans TaxID=1742973 RepID=A0A0S4LPF8_9BACT|nr:conserved hypothetical protein [Candidatus Nitrospira nitrificans]
MWQWALLLAVFAILQTGCAEFHVVANGFQHRDRQLPAQATYAILPVKGQDSDLEFQDYARMVEMKLGERGYRRADLSLADMAIFIAYGINSAGVRNYAYSLPIYGTNNFSGSSFGSGGMTTFSGTTSGVVGSQTVSGSVREYTRILIVDVVDLAHYKTTSQVITLWKGDITSTGSSSDLRLVMPMLVEAGFRHFGENTKKGVRHVYSELDPEIEKLRDGK